MSIAENLKKIEKTIAMAKEKSPNPTQEVALVVVTKTRSIDEIQQVVEAGYWALGENRVQELKDKYFKINGPVTWHIIGHLQSNKVKYITDKVKLIHSVEKLSLAQEISDRMVSIGSKMDCLVQVNIANEESKFGLAEEEVLSFLTQLAQLPGIQVKGLMNIAPYFENPEEVRPIFHQMYQLFETVKQANVPNIHMDILSMGMSHDYHVAVEEGATMVRIGSCIFE